MEQIVVDTNIIIEIIARKNEKVLTFLIENNYLDKISITHITYMELLRGANNKIALAKIKKNISDIKIIDTTVQAMRYSSELIEKYFLAYNSHIADTIIASTCMHHDLPFLTLNTKDFQYIKGLQLISHKLNKSN